jgi:hypothetical protein
MEPLNENYSTTNHINAAYYLPARNDIISLETEGNLKKPKK